MTTDKKTDWKFFIFMMVGIAGYLYPMVVGVYRLK